MSSTMGFAPGLQYDLFVSYARIDDAADVGQPHGWVTVLKEHLNNRLDMRLGSRSKIWMDHQLVAEAKLSQPIMQGLEQSASLLVILSRAYLNSVWCTSERGGFLDGLQDRLAAQRPVFLVECDELDRAELPKEFGDLLAVRFWRRDTDGAAPQRLGDPLPTLEDRTYWTRLNDLSFKVSEQLSRRKTSQGESTPASKAQPAVFLAEVTDDLLDENERVQRSLEQEGLSVLPDRAYPRDQPEAFADAMNKDLGRCKAFVQLLGKYPGRVRGWSRSLAAVQYETARLAGVTIKQWRRFELGNEEIKDDAHRELAFGPYVVNDGLEVFIADVVKTVARVETIAPPPARDSLLVFVNHNASDAKVAAELCEFFDAQGLGSLRPEPHDTAEAIRADLEDNLKLCDGLVLVYGNAPSTWIRQQLKETLKIKGARERPLARIALCHAEPNTDKADPGIQLPNQRIVECRLGLDAKARQALTEFVNELRPPQ